MLRKVLPFAAVALLFSTLGIAQSAATPRHFTFHYAFKVQNVTAGQPLRVWIPLAHSDAFQDVKVTAMTGDLPLKKTKEPLYGNTMLFAQAANAEKSEYSFAVDYEVTRHERAGLGGAAGAKERAAVLHRELQPDALVPVSGLPAELAAKETQGKSGSLEKARAIYEYVFRTMRYDKSGTGWGRGDTLWACDARHGNCTDFHSVFMSMARSQGIPSRFAIGFPLPADKHASEIPGYHCWADFYVDQRGWVPVDISEAWKHQEKKEYFFGTLDSNRFELSKGRDLRLTPAQEGPPLNYFVYPYVEVGGKAWPNVNNAFSFADVVPVTGTR